MRERLRLELRKKRGHYIKGLRNADSPRLVENRCFAAASFPDVSDDDDDVVVAPESTVCVLCVYEKIKEGEKIDVTCDFDTHVRAVTMKRSASIESLRRGYSDPINKLLLAPERRENISVALFPIFVLRGNRVTGTRGFPSGLFHQFVNHRAPARSSRMNVAFLGMS